MNIQDTSRVELNTATSRIAFADILRGLSIMSVVILHTLERYNFFSPATEISQCALLNTLDSFIWNISVFFISGKAYIIFALLFGFSFYIQNNHQENKGKDFTLRFLWRMFILLIIATIYCAFYTGEILTVYVIISIILPFLNKLNNKALAWISGLLLIQPVFIIQIIISVYNPEYELNHLYSTEIAALGNSLYEHGSFIDSIKFNLQQGLFNSTIGFFYDYGRYYQTAGLFLIGLLIGRMKLLTDNHYYTWKKILIASIVSSIILYIIKSTHTIESNNPIINQELPIIINSLFNLTFSFFMISSLYFLYYKTSFQKALNKIVPYGKASLTNYVYMGIIGVFLFNGWGLGLYNKLGITYCFIIGMLIIVLQYKLSNYWFTRHDRGPIESVWKKLTWINFRKKNKFHG